MDLNALFSLLGLPTSTFVLEVEGGGAGGEMCS